LVPRPLFESLFSGDTPGHVGRESGGLLRDRHRHRLLHHLPDGSPEWRLFITTGFCGGLTTFSTFSAEVVILMQSGRSTLALGAVGAHLGGSLLMTFAGIATVAWLKG
jgi:hypothetical protein